MWRLLEKDEEAFRELVLDKGIEDPREVWNVCVKHNRKLRVELANANAKIEAAEELIRVAKGLRDTREMMTQKEVPLEVRQVIVAHWWTQMVQLFVKWGVVIPEEIDAAKEPWFKLVEPGCSEAELRAKLHQYKDRCEYYKKMFHKLTIDNMELEEKLEKYKSTDVDREIVINENEDLPGKSEDNVKSGESKNE